MSQDDDLNEREIKSIREQAAEWFVRRTSGPSPRTDEQTFEQWLSTDPRHRSEYQAIQGVWRALDDLENDFTAPPVVTKPIPGKRAWILTAALTIGLFVVAFALTQDPGSYSTAKGELRTLHLNDGSIVRLNSDTRLHLAMSNEQRLIQLDQGEAYFEVARDPDRPFIVVASGGRAKALGTRFSVYRQPAGVRVIVSEGHVEVSIDSGRRSVLDKQESIAFSTDGSSFSAVKHIDPEHNLSWLDGRLSFDNTPLSDVVSELNRYLENPLRIARTKEVEDLRLSGTFRISNLDALPELLPRLLPIRLEPTEDGALTLYARH